MTQANTASLNTNAINESRQPPNILLVTTLEIETRAVLSSFQEAVGEKFERQLIRGKTHYQLGIVNGVNVYLVQSEIGSDELEITVLKSIEALLPVALISVGIAAGFQLSGHQFGDVLVSTDINLYEYEKHSFTFSSLSSSYLLDKFRSGAVDWGYAEVHFGSFVSANQHVNDPESRDYMRKLAPRVVGVEMGGAGLFRVADQKGVDWLIVKAVADFADREKIESKRKQAAANAARFTTHVLMEVDLGYSVTEKLSTLLPQEAEATEEVQSPKEKPHITPSFAPHSHAEPKARITLPPLAGYSSDSAIGIDQLGITDDVVAFSKVLASKDIQPPICLGLFGDWGSGKTFFMTKMEDEIRTLANRARSAENKELKTAYCSNIVQITFNAWHYIDADLWAGLISHIFEQLASHLSAEEQALLFSKLQTAKVLLDEAQCEKVVAENARKQIETELQSLQAEREKKSADLRCLWIESLKTVLTDNNNKKVLDEAAQQLGMPQAAETIEEVETTLQKMRSLQGRAQTIFLALFSAPDRWTRIGLLIGLLIAVPLIGLAVAWGLRLLQAQEAASAIVTFVTQFTTFVLGIIVWLNGALKKAASAINHLEATQAKVETILKESRKKPSPDELSLQKEIEGLREREEDAQKSLTEAKARMVQAEVALKELQEMQNGQRLAEFIQERVASEDYRRHLGIISVIRRDLKSLSDFLRKNAEVGADGKAQVDSALPRIDRIILYIDDLDRCSENRVVEVLQAVHLLLAFELFVVVVGVDSRWLIHSLGKAYPSLQAGESKMGEWLEEERSAWETTPQNYLEKIFQIPYNLRPMEASGFHRLVNSILPLAEPVATIVPDPSPPPATVTVHEENTSTDILPFSHNKLISPIDAHPSEAPDQFSQHQPEETFGDLTPEILKVEAVEREFIQHLAAMIPTPRAVKRFVNVYRFIRAKLPVQDLPGFVGTTEKSGEFQVVMVLLAMLTGFPRQSPYVFRKIIHAEKTASWRNTISGLRPQQRTGINDNTYYNSLLPNLSKAEAIEWKRLYLAFSTLENIPDEMGSYALWAREVARFSFRVGKVFQSYSLSSDVRITRIELNPEVQDEPGEYVLVTNLGDAAQMLTNWTLRDKAHHTFTFPEFTLPAGGIVRVWVKEGQNTPTDLYWGLKASVWNNTGDTAYLHDSSGIVIATYLSEDKAQVKAIK